MSAPYYRRVLRRNIEGVNDRWLQTWLNTYAVKYDESGAIAGNVDFAGNVTVAGDVTVSGDSHFAGAVTADEGGTDGRTILGNAGVHAYRTTNLSITSGSTAATLGMDAEVRDDWGGHDNVTNNDRITVIASGWYMVSVSLYWQGSAAGNRRAAYIRVNGSLSALPTMAPAGSSSFRQVASVVMYLAANDYITVTPFQDSGGALNVQGSTSTNSFVKVAKLF